MTEVNREIYAVGGKCTVDFESLEEAMAGAKGPELLIILEKLYGLVFKYDNMDMGSFSKLRDEATRLLRNCKGKRSG